MRHCTPTGIRVTLHTVRRGFAVLTSLVLLSPLAQPGCAAGSSLPSSDDAGLGTDAPLDSPSDATGSADGDGGPTEGGGVSAQHACGDWVSNYCSQLETCANFELVTVYGDKITCSSQLQRLCLDVLAAPNTGFTGDALEACLVKTKAEDCFSFLYGKPAPPECQIFGTTDNGKGCRYDSQCRSGYCKLSGSCGNCVMRGLTGSPCSAASDCDSNLMCAGNMTCQPPQDTGATCDMTRPCKQGLVCANGTCAAKIAMVGASCAGGLACDDSQGLYCDGGTMTCMSYGIPTQGQPCDPTTNRCFGYGACSMGTCVAASTDGTMCNAMQSIGCVPPDTCTAGTCTLFTANQCM
ncbi:MAG TPA: hypothetical protein VE987_11510 [Polyangiaceae bacterium]|nr:hypothetical protein [Polyangiaceae bacterium]